MKHRLLTIPDSTHSIECILYDTRCEMWEAIDKGVDFDGFYQSLFIEDERPAIMGCIHLVHDYFGGGVVAHEILHAVLDVGFALVAEKDEDGDYLVDDTEALCNMMGDLTAQFWHWYYELQEEAIDDNTRGIMNAN